MSKSTMSKSLKLSIASALGGASLLMAQPLWAAGFSLLEQNTSGLGNSYAGSAAVAEDASTIFFNSAGLTQLDKPSVVVNANLIDVSSKFHDDGSQRALLGGHSLGSEGGDAGGSTLVPAIYVAVPLTEIITGGVGVNAPFGLKTEYDPDWLGRFQAVKSDVKTMNINTALAFKLNPMVSFGIGLDYQTIDAELTKTVNYTGVVALGAQQLVQRNQLPAGQVPGLIAAAGGLEGLSSVKGNDAAWGYDAGMLLNFGDHSRVGLSYRSAIKYKIRGAVSFATPVSGVPLVQQIMNGLVSGPVELDIKLPAVARVAGVQDLGTKVQLLGEVSWTQWSSIQELQINRTDGTSLSNTPEKWSNTWRYALGANYQLSPAVKLRVGAALDKSPVPDATRTPRLPDNNRTWYSAGAKVALTKHAALDVGYARVTAKDAALNQNDGNALANGLISGHQKTSINIFGAQASVTF